MITVKTEMNVDRLKCRRVIDFADSALATLVII